MNQQDSQSRPVSRRSILLDFLGSMNLAITILVIIAIASAIGTVLQQNQGYTDYIIKFGPFWHEFFKTLDLYDVYSASWFLILLAFLVVSTSVCIYRNAPVMLREMQNYRLNSTIKSLKTIEGSQQWPVDVEDATIIDNVSRFFEVNHYRVRQKKHDDRTIIAGMRGRWNRPGYIFAHLGIIVLLLGGVMDSTVDIGIRSMLGMSELDKTADYVKDMKEKSRLQPNDLLSFRGNISISEGQTANFALLHIRDGSMVQYLPFAIKLKDFRIEHYETGMPKSFESDLVIIDKDQGKTFEKTISVNHPLQYRGYTIYQASFSDGGSKLKTEVWPFHDPKLRLIEVDSAVQQNRELRSASGNLTLEFTNFKQFNVFPAQEDDKTHKKFVNYGPSVEFKVRDKNGEAKEYQNFMSPIEQSGRYFFISAVRGSPSEQFRYMNIPADDKFTIERFMKFHALINDAEQVQKIATQTVAGVLRNMPDSDKYRDSIIRGMMDMLDRFNYGGYEAIKRRVDEAQVDKAEKEKMFEGYMKVLNTILQALYRQVLINEGVDTSKSISEAQSQFYTDALVALNNIPYYGTPFYLQLTDFKHIEASGLSVAKLPGKNVFYLGSVMSIIGIFLLLYLNQQRLWAVLYRDEAGQRRLLFAGSGNRETSEFHQEFAGLVQKLGRLIEKTNATQSAAANKDNE